MGKKQQKFILTVMDIAKPRYWQSWCLSGEGQLPGSQMGICACHPMEEAGKGQLSEDSFIRAQIPIYEDHPHA